MRCLNIFMSVIFTGVFILGASSFAGAAEVGDKIELPAPRHEGGISVEEAIYKRKSIRRYSTEPLTLEQVSQLLWATGGMTVDGVTGPTRSYASAGGRYPLDIYLVAGKVTSLESGVYRYDWAGNSLTMVKKGDIRQGLMAACSRQGMIGDAPVTIVVTTSSDKARTRYGARGEDYILYDAGHLGQNVHLQAESMALGTCMIGAFGDKDVANILGVPAERVVYVMPVGKPAK